MADPPGPIQAAIFDLDGTLADTMPILLQGLKDVVEDITGQPVAEQDVLDRYGPPDHEVLADLIGTDELSAEHDARYRKHVRKLTAGVPRIPGVENMLVQFREAGVRTAVYSARGTEYARIIVDELGLAPHLDEVWGGDMAARVKPAPDGITRMLDEFGVEPHRAAYVGDSENDLLAASAAGVTGVLVLWSSTPQPHLRTQADLVVHTAAELVDWVLGDV